MDYFVYLHRRASNNKIFYVGKGCRYRHKKIEGRSQHWQNIVNKHGYNIEIVQHGMQEWWAFELERELILKYKDQGLCNLTDGGEGASGFKITEETRRKHKETRWSKEWRNNISKKAKERFKDPEFLARCKERQKIVMNREDVKQKIRQATIKTFSNPQAREKARETTLKQFSNPAAIETARKKALQRFDTPEKRAAHVQAKAIICVETGVIFGTGKLAEEWLKSTIGRGDNSQISKVCRGIIKSAYGYTWRFVTPAKESAKQRLAD
jgi:hypothetical protein